MNRAALAALCGAAALAASCSQPAPDAPPSPTSSSSEASPAPTRSAAPAPATLAGEWKVAAIDGKDFNESYGLALSADAREIWWAPRCAGMVRG